MDPKRLLQLKQMGLTYWQVRRPQLFVGSAKNDHCPQLQYQMLLVTGEVPDATQQRLIANVLMALQLSADECQITLNAPDTEQLYRFRGLLWYAGIPLSEQAPPQRFLVTPSLSQLLDCPQAKRALWRQMEAYV